VTAALPLTLTGPADYSLDMVLGLARLEYDTACSSLAVRLTHQAPADRGSIVLLLFFLILGH
jgi:hypothetical protein